MANAPKSHERKQRLAAALRENLKRRKARERALAGNLAQNDGQSGESESGRRPAAKPE